MHVERLYRYPVKGLSPEPLDEVVLEAGYGFPRDRGYAVTDGSLDFDPAHPVAAPKTQFLMLAKYERLAKLKTRMADDPDVLTIAEDGHDTRTFALDDDAGKKAFADFLGRYVAAPLPGQPKTVHAPGHQFTDVSVHSIALMRSISLINAATVRDLSRRVGVELDPLRFRGNVLFDGAEPGSELEWVGRTLRVGDIEWRVVRRTKRCAATAVNPATGVRDVNVPIRIRDEMGHGDLGIYVEVVRGGTLRPHAEIVLD